MKEVKKLVVGALSTNSYLLIEDNHCIIVDPGANPKRILENVSGYIVDGICLLTYGLGVFSYFLLRCSFLHHKLNILMLNDLS